MPVQTIDIDAFLKKSEGRVVVDVRSPSEYRHAHLPGAVSLPIFNDEERAIIGTAYKQQGREVAVDTGLKFFSSRMKEIRSQLLDISSDTAAVGSQDFFIYCWRGGMRSGAVAWLLSLYGYKVFVLSGGYKSFRRWALDRFNDDYHLKVLGGFTGSGKTELLNELCIQEQPAIDLERLAGHRGSAFGGLGMAAQPSQEMFENRLAVRLRECEKAEAPIWVEDESRHIGKVYLPKPFWEKMRVAPLYFIDVEIRERLQRILHDYGGFGKGELKISVDKIARKLGGLNAGIVIRHIDEGNLEAAFTILLEYYDKQYAHSLKLHEESGIDLHKIVCSNVDRENVRFLL